MLAQKSCERIIALSKAEDGYQTLEYALLVAFVIFPLVKVVPYLIDVLRSFYALESFTISLPFP